MKKSVDAHILRKSDYATAQGLTTTTHSVYHLESSDFARVHCVAEDGTEWDNHVVEDGTEWDNHVVGIRTDQEIKEKADWSKSSEASMKLNVLIFGFDSMSRLNFIRQLPKSYTVLKSMNAIVLEGYNIVGDGTPQALIPMLTGFTELELPDTRRRMGSRAQYCDVYPFIWKDYQTHGYVTLYGEDTPEFGTYTYRLKGFQDQPTHHWLSTFFRDSMSEQKKDKFCLKNMPRHRIMMDYMKHFYTVYPSQPKFGFVFHAEYSHNDFNLVALADSDFSEWFANVRNTQQGKLEERLPFFSFVFPPWFATKYPEAHSAFTKNADRLATPFDIHATLADVLSYDNASNAGHYKKSRSNSLFKEIPPTRTCQDAFIEPHWCACLDWEMLSPKHEFTRRIADYFVTFLNDYNVKFTTACEPLAVGSILWAGKLIPNKSLRSFKTNRDLDGFIPDLTDQMDIKFETYQLKVETLPGRGIFEFSIVGDISRINEYGKQASCIYDTFQDLRKFCYCKQQS
ncbi:hypothetical protein M8J76_001109 [Diaphorina citri]|nr:hypothetical protein M8J76_001109 [Diaphorina citri]